eukprot:380305-Amphidinium_carterae.1
MQGVASDHVINGRTEYVYVEGAQDPSPFEWGCVALTSSWWCPELRRKLLAAATKVLGKVMMAKLAVFAAQVFGLRSQLMHFELFLAIPT